MRVTPDDEVYRVNTVWLGPSGLTFPWTARYLAYATWLVTFLVVLFVEAVTPLTVHIPPIWELCITTLFTYGVMGFVDHERPVGAVWKTFVSDLSTPRPGRRLRRTRTQPSVRVRESRVRTRVADTPGGGSPGAGGRGSPTAGAGGREANRRFRASEGGRSARRAGRGHGKHSPASAGAA